jgi:hypothetical protein
MDWYCVLTDYLLYNVDEDSNANKGDIADGGGPPKPVRKQLE